MKRFADRKNVFFNTRNKSLLFWILNISFWVFFILRDFLGLRYLDPGMPHEFLLASITYLSGFVISILVRYCFIKLLSGIPSLARIVLLLTIILLLSAVIWKFLDSSVSYPFWTEKRQFRFDGLSWVDHFMDSFNYLLTLLVWGAVYFIVFLWERLVIQEYKKQEAENLATMARFQMLQNQLNPHFLFNSLNSIRALVFENPVKASELVTDLSGFLRYNLQQSDLVSIPLDQEVSAINYYLSIEKKRFEESLHYKIDIEPDCREFRVIPNLLLPLVDNAVKYGMQMSPAMLNIVINANKTGEFLTLSVCNTGSWSDEVNRGSGKGIRNVRERLENTYGDHYHFDILKEPGCVTIIIQIPYKDETNIPFAHRG